MEETPKRPPADPPTQFGSAAAVSNSADNLRSDETLVPLSRSAETVIVPPSRSDETIITGAGNTRADRAGWGDKDPELQPGTILANRYEILSVLGTGGMGSVYKAQDRELDRLVALKVIRPELARNPAIVDRFKQELRLSHKVTHRNVVRMYDLSEDSGMRFVTMELVIGRDLRSILEERGKLPPDEAVDIFQQICIALHAAHSVGILHRDLKPQNVMREDDGRVVVMDFGLARTIEGNDGLTQTGALIGTLDYMSPEQALGKKLDQRSDIFTLGLIGYEMLTGAMPFRAESAIASLLSRTQQRAVPVADVDKNIPGTLSNIIAKCLEKDPANRYQSAEELDADIRAWQGKGGGKKVSASSTRMRIIRIRELPWQRFAVTGVVIVAIAAAVAWFAIRRQLAAKSATHAPVSVLVGDFQNNTGDPVLDNTLEPMLGLALEGASFINASSREDARKLAEKLPNPTSRLDEQSARLVAQNEDVNAIITGEINLRGDGYDISAVALDAVSGKELAKSEITVANKQDILKNLPQLAAPIRKALGDTTPASVQFDEVSGGFKAASLEAVHQDAIGVDEQFAGKFQEAFDSFQKAAQLDPNFARPYTGMAAMAQNLGKPGDALNYMKLAMQHEDTMTERERYRDRGLYYLITSDWQDCVQEYTQLVTRYPADRVGQNNLSGCYTQLRDAPKALQAAKQAVKIVPKGVGQLLNLAFISTFAGDFAESENEAHTALQINPKAAQAFLVLAEAQLGQGQIDKAAESYQKLETLGPVATSTAAAGLADLAAYQDKHADAESILAQAAAADVAAKNTDNAARKYVALGYIEEIRGKHAAAIADTDKALAQSQSTTIEFLAAGNYVESGEFAKAQKLATTLSSALATESQAYGKIIDGMIALKRKDTNEAIRQVRAANNLLDTWIGHFDLGLAYLDAGAFTQADSEFDECIKRRGEAIELFMDNVPTYAYFPPVYYYEGRAREGMKSEGFAEFYKTYLSIRGQSSDDPLVADIRHRLGN
ncbi:Serine/threonine protein kinase with TPR repeats [Candidatus Sulfotelmatomonas gaucii]|uniref:non-specific serine/threonine protein kinase n=1 Tax=Candidatus Sulfuritelmatomonas gaucii TaxID=2043161 RepID=A0A2N9LZU4_9BACT|nr:Serine/threonine protein kinase with TPR repeats [Candidatus Sulfotelmatomonas gaucii]